MKSNDCQVEVGRGEDGLRIRGGAIALKRGLGASMNSSEVLMRLVRLRMLLRGR